MSSVGFQPTIPGIECPQTPQNVRPPGLVGRHAYSLDHYKVGWQIEVSCQLEATSTLPPVSIE